MIHTIDLHIGPHPALTVMFSALQDAMVRCVPAQMGVPDITEKRVSYLDRWDGQVDGFRHRLNRHFAMGSE